MLDSFGLARLGDSEGPEWLLQAPGNGGSCSRSMQDSIFQYCWELGEIIRWAKINEKIKVKKRMEDLT